MNPKATKMQNGQERTSSQVPSFSIDTSTLMKIASLELRAKAVVEGFMSGLHRSPYHGFSVEFSDYRPYSPGDDLRYLDWRLLARSDRRYIKRFEDETNLRCYLVLDNSRSMQFGVGEVVKAEYAKTLAATLAYFFTQQRDAVGLLTFDQKIQELIQPRFRPGHLRRIMVALDRAPDGQATDVRGSLEQLATTFHKRGLVILVSDLLTPALELRKPLAILRSRGHEVILLRVLDPTEVTFDFREPKIFVDVESGRDLYVDPISIRDRYQTKFREHEKQIQALSSELGIEYYRVTTDQAMDRVLFNVITSRMESRSVSHRRATAAGTLTNPQEASR
ncbi:MAG: DUF58 domain-containing protein [Pirellulaceae bacterium]